MEIDFAEAIDGFILYLATERGLSENYQLLTRRSLEKFADWANNQKQLTSPHQVELAFLSQFLATEKERGLAAGSMKLVVVALKIFFRFLKMRLMIDQDPAELLPLPRLVFAENLESGAGDSSAGDQSPKSAIPLARLRDPGVVLRVRTAH